MLKGLVFFGQAALLVFVTLVLAGAFAARQRADLESWHTVVLDQEFRAGSSVETLEEYLENEQALFRQLEDRIISGVPSAGEQELNRYSRQSLAYPVRGGQDWNRTQVGRPDSIRGGILLLHGMTDSPYSMRHLGDLFEAQGFYVLNLRMPGHGTIPSGLATADWRDWEAAVRLGARDVQEKLGPGQPFYIAGYSNGGALALSYTLDSLQDTELRIPDHLFLMSPMLGVSQLARFGKIYYWLSRLDFFEKASWLDIVPEYDPHKYNSFPMNGPRQSLALTARLNERLRRMSASGSLTIMPPVLTFQSLVDATVRTQDIVTRLYDRLPANGSELVVFDVNRRGVFEFFVRPELDALLAGMLGDKPRHYLFTLVTNESSAPGRAHAVRKRPHREELAYQELDYRWPVSMFSLSHVAIPFPPDDEVYGFAATPDPNGFPNLGAAQVVGENGAMTFPSSLVTRVRSNPFHGYMVSRIEEVID